MHNPGQLKLLLPSARPDRFPDRSAAELSDWQLSMISQIKERRGNFPAPFSALIGSPDIANRFEQLTASLWSGSLPVALLEFVYLVTAREYQCGFQWHTHRAKAVAAGVSEELIQAAGSRTPVETDDPDARLYCDVHRFLIALRDENSVGDELFATVASRLSEAQMSELLAFFGIAAAVSLLLNVRQPAYAGSLGAHFR